ncbi:MAG: GNAT family N-acetyltransferase [Candidatus Eiseniibacteriota bacterium]
MTILETERLALRRFTLDDAEFAYRLVNDPAWIQNIGDRNVRSLGDARGYLAKGPLAMYETYGFGMWVATLKATGEPIGTCGLIKRESLDHVDIGFAFLPEFRGQGYALESAIATLDYGRREVGLTRIVAIVSPANQPSIRILEKLGLRFEREITMPGETEAISLYATP